jgi:hypothetical protein
MKRLLSIVKKRVKKGNSTLKMIGNDFGVKQVQLDEPA